MKFNCQVDINRPLNKVIELFDNPENMKEWQDGFVSFNHISGIPGQVGAVSKIRYKMGKREFDLLETITLKNLPWEFSGTYVHSHMTNIMTNKFDEIDSENTRWTAELEYTKLKGIIPKLMTVLAPSIFKKQTQKWLNQFKDFAERS